MLKRLKSILCWLAPLGALVLLDVLGPGRITRAQLALGAHALFNLGPLTVSNALLCSVLATVVLVAVALFVGRRIADAPRAGSPQNVVETLVQPAVAMPDGQPRARVRVGRAVWTAALIYVCTAQILALLPGSGSIGLWQTTGTQRFLVPLLRGATSDWNTIIALVLCAVLAMMATNLQARAASRMRSRREVGQMASPKRRLKRLLIPGLLVLLLLADAFGPLRVKEVRISLAAEEVARIGAFRITNTLLASWVAVVLLILLALLGRRRLVDAPRPYSLQNILETIFELLSGFMEGVVGAKARAFFPVVCTLFLYILTMNWMGMLPGVGSLGFWTSEGGERIFTPILRGATSDLSTTLALAICAVISLQVFSIRFLGLKDYTLRFVAIGRFRDFVRAKREGHKASPSLLFRGALDLFVGALDIFEEITKVFSFSFRLFGNVFAGEVLLTVIAFLAPYEMSVPFMALELFVGLIQAFIFAALTTAFLGKATTSEGAYAHQTGSPTHSEIASPSQ